MQRLTTSPNDKQAESLHVMHCHKFTVTPTQSQIEGIKMTEMNEIVEQGVSPDLEPQAESQANNDMLSKTTVSKIVERERLKAFEKGKQEAIMELQQQQMQQEQAPVQQPVAAPQQLGGMAQLSAADIERMIAEKAPQMLQEHVNNLKTEQMVNSFVSKMQAAEAKYPGLEAKLNDLDYNSMAPLVSLANDMENTGDIMKELLDNPMKMANLLTLQYTQPMLAKRAMTELSNSIRTNQEALAQEKQAQDPMSQLKPSNAGMDNSAMSVQDFRKMFRG